MTANECLIDGGMTTCSLGVPARKPIAVAAGARRKYTTLSATWAALRSYLGRHSDRSPEHRHLRAEREVSALLRSINR